MKKRFFSLLLAVAMVISIAPIALAEDTNANGNFVEMTVDGTTVAYSDPTEFFAAFKMCIRDSYNGLTPRFDRMGRLLLDPPGDGQTMAVDDRTAVSALEYRHDRYGVLSQVVVRHRTGGVSQTCLLYTSRCV